MKKSATTNRLHQGATIVTQNLTYSVRQKKDKTEKLILNDVNFVARPGELLAIMGPSGSGKTTFLNALAGRLRTRKNASVSGAILCNGNPSREFVKRLSNYVMQDDHLYDFLTVKETLTFAARLRLRDLPVAERTQRVADVMQELGLNGCQDVVIGGEYKKGISGGQRKRVSIGVEMLDDPELLFLDEPTSGLDSSLAHDVLKVLVRLAKSGRTIICTVHQPRSQVFTLFDQLMLLSKGRPVYQGPASDARDYFASIGHACPSSFNPADFFLDLLSADTSIQSQEEQDLDDAAFPTPSEHLDVTPLRSSSSMVLGRVVIEQDQIDALPEHFQSSTLGKAVADAIETALASPAAGNPVAPKRLDYMLLWLKQWFSSFLTLTFRSFLNNLRNPMQAIALVTVNTVFGLMIGGIFFQIDRQPSTPADTEAAAMNFLGCLFVVASQYMFTNMDCLLAFPRERIIFNREISNGLYPSSCFFLAKTVADLPFQQLPPMMFSLLAYFLSGLGGTFYQFFVFFINSHVAVFAAASYYSLVGACVARFEVANIAAPFGGVLATLLAGFYLKDDDVPGWISWFKYLVFLRYSFFSFVQNEFPEGDSFGVGAGTLPNSFIVGSLARVPSGVSLWMNTFISLCLGCLYRFIAFLCMKYMHRGIGVEA